MVVPRSLAGARSQKNDAQAGRRAKQKDASGVLTARSQSVRRNAGEFEGAGPFKRLAWKPANGMIDECDRERKRNGTPLHPSRIRLGVINSAAALCIVFLTGESCSADDERIDERRAALAGSSAAG